MITGLQGSPTTVLTNLQYADVALIFEREDLRVVIIIKCIFLWYDAYLGLKINFHKSSLIFLGEINTANDFILEVMGYKEEKLLVKYLDISVKAGRLNRRDWLPSLMLLKEGLKVGETIIFGWKSHTTH